MKIRKRRQMMSYSVFIVNFKHPFDLFLVFSIGDFEQEINSVILHLPLYIPIL